MERFVQVSAIISGKLLLIGIKLVIVGILAILAPFEQ
jgi:hypothetical protein